MLAIGKHWSVIHHGYWVTCLVNKWLHWLYWLCSQRCHHGWWVAKRTSPTYDLPWPSQVGEEIYVCKIRKRKNTTWDIMPPICIHIDIVSCFETLWSDDSHQASPDNAKRVSKAACPLWGMVSGLMLCHLDSQWTVVLCLLGGRIALLILLWNSPSTYPYLQAVKPCQRT